MTAITIQYSGNWEMSFYIMSINMAALTFGMAIYNNEYINIDVMIKEKKKIAKSRARSKLYQAINPDNGEMAAALMPESNLNQINEAASGLSEDTVDS